MYSEILRDPGNEWVNRKMRKHTDVKIREKRTDNVLREVWPVLVRQAGNENALCKRPRWKFNQGELCTKSEHRILMKRSRMKTKIWKNKLGQKLWRKNRGKNQMSIEKLDFHVLAGGEFQIFRKRKFLNLHLQIGAGNKLNLRGKKTADVY